MNAELLPRPTPHTHVLEAPQCFPLDANLCHEQRPGHIPCFNHHVHISLMAMEVPYYSRLQRTEMLYSNCSPLHTQLASFKDVLAWGEGRLCAFPSLARQKLVDCGRFLDQEPENTSKVVGDGFNRPRDPRRVIRERNFTPHPKLSFIFSFFSFDV